MPTVVPDAVVSQEFLSGVVGDIQSNDTDRVLTPNLPINLMTDNQSSFEGTAGITVDTGEFYWEFSNPLRDLSIVEHGSNSLKLQVTSGSGATNAYFAFNGIPVKQDTVYTWQARVYTPSATVLNTGAHFHLQATSPDTFQRFATMNPSPAYNLPQGWSTIFGTGKTAAGTFLRNGTAALILGVARTANNGANDVNVPLYYDKIMVSEWPYPRDWVLGVRAWPEPVF